MKRVDITSKVVGRYSSGKPVGGGISIPMGNYALKSDFESLKSMFNDFLEGDDTDSVINRWKDLEAFLNGISEDNTLDSILKDYVTLSGTQTITGEKNFVGGLKVNGSPIYYDTEKKYWKLEGDLLVTGGVTMYGKDSEFTPSTIMDAILYDDSTLGINSQGQLYVKGGTGGGGISSITSQMIVDALGYTPASATALSGYLPLSGGTITNSSAVPLTINANNDGQVGLFLQSKGNNKTYVGWDSSRGTCLYEFASGSSLNILNGVPRFNTNTLWHSGNFTPSNYLPLTGGTISGDIGLSSLSIGSYDKSFASAGVIEKLNLMSDVSNYRTFLGSIYQNDSWNTIISVRHRNGVSDGNLYGFYLLSPVMTDKSNTDLYFRKQDYYGWGDSYKILHSGNISSYNAGSATKLATARTIWGQSFDGTGNVDGDLTTNGGITMRTGTAFDASKYLTLINNASQYGRIGITFNGSTQDGNDNWGEGGRSIISFRRKYGTATSYAFSYAIQHNLVDNTLGILYGSNVGILLNGAGNVGIGTTNPTQKLHVAGPVLADSFYARGGIYGWNADTSTTFNNRWGMYQWGHLLQITQRDTHNNFMTTPISIDLSNGRVAILKQQPTCALDVSGDILASGGITMYSDERKKTILNHVELSLKEIANAPLIEHYYNSDQNKTTHVGSIAQYWAEMNDWFCKKDSEGFYTMEIQNAALASAISIARELDKYESKTDKKIRQLKKRISQLEDELETLKNK